MEVGFSRSLVEPGVVRSSAIGRAVGLALLVAVIAVGLHLRYAEPLSSPVIGAEDPWTHMVFTKEHVDRGYWDDSFHLGTSLYPPGFHAWMGATWVLTGVDLYEFTRLFPPILGALGIAGVFLLASRYTGVAGGITAALLWATMPEAVFRTNLMFPTALDLAILPFMLLAAAEAARGHRAFVAAFTVMGVAVTLAHPWTILLVAGGLGVYVLLGLTRALAGAGRGEDGGDDAAPDGASGGASTLRRGGALDHVLVGALTLALVALAWVYDLRGDEDRLELLANMGWGEVAFLVAPLSHLGTGAALAVAATAIVGAWAWTLAKRRPATWRRWRTVVGLAVGVAAAAGVWAGIQPLLSDLPPFVAYQRMLGAPAIVAAFAGLALVAARATPAGLLGLAVAGALFPITAINFLDAWYIPHRTVVYMGLGIVLLGGHAVAAGASALPSLVPRRRTRVRRGVAVATVAALVVGTSGALAAAPPETYTWYRLYDASGLETFEEAVALAQGHEKPKIIVGTWQSGLYLKALGDPADVRWGPDFFKDPAFREELTSNYADWDVTAFIVVDEYVMDKVKDGEFSVDFLEQDGYERVLSETGDGGVTIYRVPLGNGAGGS